MEDNGGKGGKRLEDWFEGSRGSEIREMVTGRRRGGAVATIDIEKEG
jgi:hypothetical protein